MDSRTLFLMDFKLFRYLTTSYGSGQDIDERIVEGTILKEFNTYS